MRKIFDKSQSIVVLSGAGISAESGIKTFRDHDGLWENYSVEEVATMEGFEANPEVVQRFYNQRRKQLEDPEVKPNFAHLALAELEDNWQGNFLLVTQNVDDLHRRSGSRNLIHMHGELTKARCIKVDCKNSSRILDWSEPILPNILCENCYSTYSLRPHIVWFGERPLELERIHAALSECDIFIAIGTSGQVYPAAGFIKDVPESCRKIEVNKEKTTISPLFDEHRIGSASVCVPELVREILSKG